MCQPYGKMVEGWRHNGSPLGGMVQRSAIFLINLDRSPDRLAAMHSQLAMLGIDYVRQAGVDGAANVPGHLQSDFQGATKMKSGEIGCYASHLLVCEQVVRRELDYGVVIEDDIVVDPDMIAVTQGAAQSAPADWDVIHLSTRFKRAAWPLLPLQNGRTLVRYARLPVNSAAYLISWRGASKMLARMPRRWPVDMEFRYAWHRSLEIYGVFPAPARQREDVASMINSDRSVRYPVRSRHSLRRTDFEPGLPSRIKGWFYVKRRLGIRGAAYCWLQGARGLTGRGLSAIRREPF